MTASLRVTVDARLCVGAAMCVQSAPEVFVQGEDGVSGVARPETEPAWQTEVHEAAALCPVQAIRVESC